MRLAQIIDRYDDGPANGTIHPQEREVETLGEKKIKGNAPTKVVSHPIVYVSPDAHYWEISTEEAAHYGRDISQVDADNIGRVYRLS